MAENIFLKEMASPSLKDYMQFQSDGRANLGGELPVAVYRLLEYSIKEELRERYGKEKQVEIFRSAGYRAGKYFADQFLDLTLPMNAFVAELQRKLEELRIGVLRIEKIEDATGRIVLTVAEDADCSGLPILGETVCNYDEGFLSGVLSEYTGKPYEAIEIDCWATGSRVCRFCADVREEEKQ